MRGRVHPPAANLVFTLPLVGRVGRRSAAEAGGVGVGVGGRDSVLQLRPPPPTPPQPAAGLPASGKS